MEYPKSSRVIALVLQKEKPKNRAEEILLDAYRDAVMGQSALQTMAKWSDRDLDDNEAMHLLYGNHMGLSKMLDNAGGGSGALN